MRIGILSDTHGHIARTQIAVNLLLTKGCEVLFHCGDLGSEAVMVELAAACQPKNIPVYAVTGNVDLWDPGVMEFPSDCGINLKRHHELTLDGHAIAIVHGDDARLYKKLTHKNRFDLVFTGHTHEAADTMDGRTRIINPGAIYRASRPSVATFDLAGDLLSTFDLPA